MLIEVLIIGFLGIPVLFKVKVIDLEKLFVLLLLPVAGEEVESAVGWRGGFPL